jgi:hypothetical protein
MIVLIAPAVLDGPGGASASVSFYDRLGMMVAATLYSILAVRVYDAFRPMKQQDRQEGTVKAESSATL